MVIKEYQDFGAGALTIAQDLIEFIAPLRDGETESVYFVLEDEPDSGEKRVFIAVGLDEAGPESSPCIILRDTGNRIKSEPNVVS